MRILDLTHEITPGMSVYPGTEPCLEAAGTYERDGFRETKLTLFSHTGTHMDAPAHVFAHGTTLDAFPVAQFAGQALVIDCTDVPKGGRIGMEHIDRELADQADFLLLRTGWEARWGTPAYFEDYPIITQEVADYLLSSGKKGLGLDAISVDAYTDESLPLHKKLLGSREFILIENLCRLGECGSGLFTFCALPLKFANADGAPARVIAILE